MVQTVNSNAGQKSAEGRFLSKWVYKFYPSQKLVHLSGYSPLKSHMGVVNFPKMCAKSSSLQPNFFWLLGVLFLSGLLFASNEQQEFEFFAIQTSHRGWSTSQKCVQNPLVSSRTFFGCQGYFFCPVYSFLLMSNKTLSFLLFKPHIGGGQLPKNPLVSSRTFFACQGYFFCPIYSFLLMSNKNLSFFSIQRSHRGWSTSQKYARNPLVSSRTRKNPEK